MSAIGRCSVAVISLVLAAAPAAALQIASALDGDSWNHRAYLGRPLLEFDSSDWAIFIHDDAPELFPPALEAVEADTTSDRAEVLFSRVWDRP